MATGVKQPREITKEQFALMCAWLLVINRRPVDDARALALMALNDFAGQSCIDCVLCDGSARPMTLSAAVAHRRNGTGRPHQLSLNESTLRVMP